MDIELIAIGDEVLYGYTVNGNGSYISQALLQEGFLTKRHSVVGDNTLVIENTIKEALLRGSFVITTGGLGPTVDDLTRKILADLFHSPLEFNQSLYNALEKRFTSRPSTLQDQATIPLQATILENRLGTASGLLLKNDDLFPKAILVALPGVPQEMRELVQRQLLPILKKESRLKSGTQSYIFPLHCMQTNEAAVDPLLRNLQKSYPNISFGIYPSQGTLSLHMKAEASSENAFMESIQEPLTKLKKALAEHIYDCPSGKIEEAVHLFLLKHSISFATAESCTGGTLASRLVQQAGASKYFKGGIIAYSNDSKEDLLGVQHETLSTKGAVSVEVTEEMAQSVALKYKATCTLAVSGILGPTGGTPEKPVGTICATITYKGTIHSWVMNFPTGNRELILEKCVQAAFSELLFLLKKCANGYGN